MPARPLTAKNAANAWMFCEAQGGTSSAYAQGAPRKIDALEDKFQSVLNTLYETHEEEIALLQAEIDDLRTARVDLGSVAPREQSWSPSWGDEEPERDWPETRNHWLPGAGVGLEEEFSITSRGGQKNGVTASKPKAIDEGNGHTADRREEKAERLKKAVLKKHGTAEIKLQKGASKYIGFQKNEGCMKHLETFVTGAHFEMIVAVIICLNGFFVASESQYSGLELGYNDKLHPSIDKPASETFPMEAVHFYADMFFGTLFTLELLIKLTVLRARFFLDLWHYIDLLVVITWLLSVLDVMQDGSLRLLRLLRLCRVTRLLKLVGMVGAIDGFDQLALMLTAVTSCNITLIWVIVLFFLFQGVLAALIFAVLHLTYLSDETVPREEREVVFLYFGTYARAFFSMFELMLANWPPITRVLAENVSEWFFLVAILYKLTMGFALVGVVNGVFMQETMKAAAADDAIMVRQKQRSVRSAAAKMQKLFAAADDSGDGALSLAEFEDVCQNELCHTWLSSMDIDTADAGALFRAIDNGDGHITADELCAGVSMLKGPAKCLDMKTVIPIIKGNVEQLKELKQMVHKLTEHIQYASLLTRQQQAGSRSPALEWMKANFAL